jgi:hypothetical protein
MCNVILSKSDNKSLEIKYEVERIIELCQELFNWELRLAKMNPPLELSNAKKMIAGWSSNYMKTINAISQSLREGIRNEIFGTIELKMEFKIESISLIEEFRNYFGITNSI